MIITGHGSEIIDTGDSGCVVRYYYHGLGYEINIWTSACPTGTLLGNYENEEEGKAAFDGLKQAILEKKETYVMP